ncbi:MAG TPA: RNA polymerase sigma factor RpoD/SigA [Solirubrobacteraceae bacterium]|nr:RNA polymerase sigma factor RpoD/SigA [Solirubrobacteraceae bacterium]
MHGNEAAIRMPAGDDSLGGAFNRALRRPPLAAEEERQLARLAADGDVKARDRLIEGNVRLVVGLARAYRGRGVPHADLVQEGMMGLMRALDGFDPSLGHRLSTYATWWVRRSMLGAINAAPSIRLPREGRRALAAIARAERELSAHGSPRPDSDALATLTGLSLRRVERLRSAPHVVASLDAPVADSETPLVEFLADPRAPEVTLAFDRAEARRELGAALACLCERVRRVIELRFGLEGGAPQTHQQIGQVLGITAERSRQLEAEGLRRLRALAERTSLAA